jgi:hypothetical protein
MDSPEMFVIFYQTIQHHIADAAAFRCTAMTALQLDAQNLQANFVIHINLTIHKL